MNNSPVLSSPSVTIIIPILNEKATILILIDQIKFHLSEKVSSLEIILVDDRSEDGSSEIIRQAAAQDSKIIGIYRQGPRGLGKSVIEGFKHANGEINVVMDGDLQHNPSYILDLVRACQKGSKVAIASRYTGDGIGFSTSAARRAISKVLTFTVRLMLSLKIDDPLSGYFAVQKDFLRKLNGRLNGVGYKILLEILAHTDASEVKEVPLIFEERNSGKSKATLRVFHQFICQLAALRMKFVSAEFISFAIVGTIGLLLHLSLLSIILGFGIRFEYAHFTSAFMTMSSNYAFNKYLTFSDVREEDLLDLWSWSLYVLAALVSLLGNTGVAIFLNNQTGLITVASLCGVIIGVAWNFLTARVILKR